MRKYSSATFILLSFLIATTAAFANSLHVQVSNEAPGGAPSEGLNDYNLDVMKRLAAAFAPPICPVSKPVKIDFDVAKDGAMTNPTMSLSSDIPIVDQSVMKAVNLAGSTFKPLPAKAPDKVHFTAEFDYVIGVGK